MNTPWPARKVKANSMTWRKKMARAVSVQSLNDGESTTAARHVNVGVRAARGLAGAGGGRLTRRAIHRILMDDDVGVGEFRGQLHFDLFGNFVCREQ